MDTRNLREQCLDAIDSGGSSQIQYEGLYEESILNLEMLAGHNGLASPLK